MADKSNLPWTTHTGRMREMERVVRADPDVGAPAFRLFSAITQGMNEQSGEYFCRDDVMLVICGVRRRQSLSEARAALAEKRLIEFEPGRSGKATIYRLLMSDDAILDRLAMLADDKIAAKLAAERPRPRKDSVRKSVHYKEEPKQEQRPEKRTLPADVVSGKADAISDDSVRKSVHLVSPKADTLHPQPTPPFLSTDGELDSVEAEPSKSPSSEPVILATIGETFDYMDSHPSEPVTAWTGLADQERGERVINGHLWRLSREFKFTVDEATEIIGDELARMKRAVAEFPGDGDRAGRRIKKLLAVARKQRAA